MAIIVEDGTGLATAETYISVADAVTYHTARGNNVWNDVVELLTLDVVPSGAGWAIGDTITGALSVKTCVVVQRLTTLTYLVKQRSGAFTLGEILSNGTATADQGAANPVFAASDLQREQCLRKATAYMEQIYGGRWKGVRTTTTQVLSWPRAMCYVADTYEYADSDAVPTTIANACADLAFKALSETLSPDMTQAVTEQTIGPITVKYSSASPQAKRYRAIDNMLKPYLTSYGIGLKVERV